MTKIDIHLEHALIDVRDMDATLGFYRKVLPGWTVRWEGRNDMGGRWAHYGPPGEGQPGYLSLYELPGAAPSGEGFGKEARIEHVGFSHPDVDALERSLASEGIRPDDRVDDGRFRRVYFTDPDGHALEFVQKLA
ncbi:MAG TPA: VOC family protein [Candidatus Saccharimonadales bacterium]|nr:VOC family protein [Candidatus Saccharimonadales bacterium]